MKRREFIAVTAGAVASPLVASAQQHGMPTIGVLVQGIPAPAPFLSALREGLREAGYVEGKNIRLEVRSAEGRAELLTERAAELVRRNVELIVAFQTPAAMAAKALTGRIPIVMAPAGDPLSTGLVASLSKPGGNVTGVSGASSDVGAKTVELIRELLPSARRIGVLASETDPFTRPFVAAINRAAQSLGLEVERTLARPGQPPEPALESMAAHHVEALIVQGSLASRDVFVAAQRHGLPSFSSNQAIATLGGFIAYGANQEALYRQVVPYIDRILNGAKPADLPVALPIKFELVINLTTAAALDITVPSSLLGRADMIIR